MNLIDTHFHLDKYRNHKELYTQINDLRQYTICVTCTPGVFLSCIKIYPETKYLKFGLGIHPDEVVNPERQLYEFDSCIDQAHYIGEIGLDYSSNKSDTNAQKKVLRHILKVQSQRNLVATIHVKKAEEDLIQLLQEYPSSKRIIHWFSGTKEQMQNLLKEGCYFSVNASMTLSESGKRRLVEIPPDRLLIESDGPYSKTNGSRFSPEKLATLYREVESVVQIANLESVVFQNFYRLLLTT